MKKTQITYCNREIKNLFKHTGLLVLTFFLFFAMSSVNAQTDAQEFSYVKIEVNGLACPFCAYGLEKKLKQIDGVETVEIDVEEGLAFLSMNSDQKATKEDLERIVTNAGFTAGTIDFSDKTFSLKDDR
jgi:copper chaperone CopZ